jgi:hypothetical protein
MLLPIWTVVTGLPLEEGNNELHTNLSRSTDIIWGAWSATVELQELMKFQFTPLSKLLPSLCNETLSTT